jgi:hypothetical protein
MKIDLMPKTAVGKWSLGLIAAMPVLFFVGATLTSFRRGRVSSTKRRGTLPVIPHLFFHIHIIKPLN